jgi:hypothetical protein
MQRKALKCPASVYHTQVLHGVMDYRGLTIHCRTHLEFET